MRTFQKKVVWGIHQLLSRFKIHLVPVHYYSPVVNLRELEANRSDWARRPEMTGIPWDGPAQLQRMKEICLPYQQEYHENKTFLEATGGQYGPGYGPLEAQALHAVVRHFKPRRLLEVGSGVSTACLLEAMALNARDTGTTAALTCVEPFPSAQMLTLQREGKVTLIDNMVQRVPMGVFEELEAGDLLFIDSSHAAKTGSDVYHIYLEILPRLKPGILIHIHDIYLPYTYGPNTLRSLWQWGETSLLKAFMIQNPRITTLFCMSFMHHDHPAEMKTVFPSYDPEEMKDGLCVADVGPMGFNLKHFPSSIYLQTL